jgi:hypothetical protein
LYYPDSFLRKKEEKSRKFVSGFCNRFNGCFEGDFFINREDANQRKEVRQQMQVTDVTDKRQKSEGRSDPALMFGLLRTS